MNYSKKERVKIVYKTYNNECMWDADKEKTGWEITNGSGDVFFLRKAIGSSAYVSVAFERIRLGNE